MVNRLIWRFTWLVALVAVALLGEDHEVSQVVTYAIGVRVGFDCENACGFVLPYGWVVEDGCLKHDIHAMREARGEQ